MWQIHTPIPASRNKRYNSHFSGYGLGWFLSDKGGKMVAEHTGGLPGMLSKTLLLPDLNAGIVILTNTEPGGAAMFNTIAQSVLDNYLKLDHFDWLSFYASQMKSMLNTGFCHYCRVAKSSIIKTPETQSEYLRRNVCR